MAEKIKKKPTGEKPATSRRTSPTTRSSRPLAEAPTPAAETVPFEPKVQAPTVDLLAPVKKVRKASGAASLQHFIRPLTDKAPPKPRPVPKPEPVAETPAPEAPAE